MNLFRKILHFLSSLLPSFISKRLLNCESVSIYLANEDSLNGSLKYKVKLHTYLCLCCKNYKEQLDFIHTQARKVKTLKLTPDQQLKLDRSRDEIVARFAK